MVKKWLINYKFICFAMASKHNTQPRSGEYIIENLLFIL